MKQSILRASALILILTVLLSAASAAAASTDAQGASPSLPASGERCVIYCPAAQAVLGLSDGADPATGLPAPSATLNADGRLTYDDVSDGGLIFRATAIKENGMIFYTFASQGRYLALTAPAQDGNGAADAGTLCLAEKPEGDRLAEIQWKCEQTNGGWVLFNRAALSEPRRCIAFTASRFRLWRYEADLAERCTLQFFPVEDREDCGYVSRPMLRLAGEPPLGGTDGRFHFTVESGYALISATVEAVCAVSEADGSQRVLRTRLPKPALEGQTGGFSVSAADALGCDRLILTLTAQDTLGRRLEAGLTTALSTLPQIPAIAPADGSTVNSNARPTISATVSNAGRWQEAPLPDNVDPVTKFRDVRAGQWYTAPVDYVVELGLMAGMTEELFGVQTELTREQFLTILWSLDGKPGHSCENPFTDVKPGGYAYNAILWAYEAGITAGKAETLFGRKDAVSRQDLACFFYRYAALRCLDTRQRASLAGFSDANRVKSYAVEPMRWAVANGLFAGSNGQLHPRDSATRAEIAAVMRRFDALRGPRMEEDTHGVTVTLRLDGVPVPARLQNGQVTYRPETDLAPGRHTVALTVTRPDGTAVSRSWAFYVS